MGYPSKPPIGTPLDWAHPLNRGLLAYWPFNEGAGTGARDLVQGRPVTLTNLTATPTSGWVGSRTGSAVAFDGSNDYGQATLNLAPFSVVTVSLVLNQTTFSSSDLLALEYTVNQNTNAALIVDPNSGAGGNTFGFGSSAGDNAKYWSDLFPQPSAKVEHRYVLVIDRSIPVNLAWVDGVAQPLTVGNHTMAGGTSFAATSPFYFMSRGGASLFNAGILSDVRLWGRALNQQEVWNLQADPYGMFARPSLARRAMPSVQPSIAIFGS